ncbi:MAG TPA: hypothetical protein VG225_05710 [Terracidiphilus sp.]|jgi:hypothetical protein|nr:hypothetical protein [Terracidiphilus sp.]
MKALGIVLMVAGLLALAYGGFTYTTHKRAVDMGPLQVERSKQHTVPLPPILGVGGILIGGILLLGSRAK